MEIICKLVSTRYDQMGTTGVKVVRSRATAYVYKMVGMQMMKTTASLRTYRLAMALTGSEIAQDAYTRRLNARTTWEHEMTGRSRFKLAFLRPIAKNTFKIAGGI